MKLILFPLLSLVLAHAAFADEIVRTAAQPQVAPMTITKTVYRTEEFMGPYSVDEAYEIDESYTEQVPYQVTETYVDHEEYYAPERTCRSSIEYEQQCNTIGNRRECRSVPKTVQRCDTMMVRKTRPVTKTRQVTKYRPEIKYRRVVKHRTVEKCCTRQTRQVPDRKFDVEVAITFPASAALVANDVEKFNAFVDGDETTATIVVKPTSAIYSYKPQVTRLTANKFAVDMQLVHTYQAADLAENTISQTQITVLGKAVSFNFIDMGNVRKVQTTYNLTLLDAQGTEILHASKSVEDQAEIHWALPATLKDGQQVKARLQVQRNGVVIACPVDFTIEKAFVVQVEEIYDVAPYMDEKLVGKFSFSGDGADLVLYFRDQTKNIASVKTTYEFFVAIDSSGPYVSKTLRREDLKVTSDGRIVVGAIKDLGFTRAQLNELHWGSSINIRNTVKRTGTKFPKGVVTFYKSVTLWTDGY